MGETRLDATPGAPGAAVAPGAPVAAVAAVAQRRERVYALPHLDLSISLSQEPRAEYGRHVVYGASLERVEGYTVELLFPWRFRDPDPHATPVGSPLLIVASIFRVAEGGCKVGTRKPEAGPQGETTEHNWESSPGARV